MLFRLANIQDIDAIMSIINEVKADPEATKRTGWDEGYPVTSDIELDINNQEGYVLTKREAVIGYIAATSNPDYSLPIAIPGKHLHLSRLVIKKSERKQGFGEHILQMMYRIAGEKAFDYIVFLVNPENWLGLKLYEKLGYYNHGLYQFEWGHYHLLSIKIKPVIKMISWNVNGLRACMSHGFGEFLAKEDPDICAVQETKMHPIQASFAFNGYYQYWNSAERPGYSGTMILTKVQPLSVLYDMPGNHPKEGRIITLEFNNYYFVDVYVPNVGRELARMTYRLTFERDFRDYLKALETKKPVIMCGDLNVAHTEMDIKNPAANENNAGFTKQERTAFTELLNKGFVDTFRYLYPTTIAYSWWSYMFQARARDTGWRIDYFIASDSIKKQLLTSYMYTEITGSDHCPVGLLFKHE